MLAVGRPQKPDGSTGTPGLYRTREGRERCSWTVAQPGLRMLRKTGRAPSRSQGRSARIGHWHDIRWARHRSWGKHMNILITGATGFIGSWVARELASRGHTLRLLVRPRSCLDNIRDIPGERFVGDITAPASVEGAVAGCDAVVHAAAVARLRAGDRDNLLAVNEGGTRNVLGAALRAGVRRA